MGIRIDVRRYFSPHPNPRLQGAPLLASEGCSSGPEHARGILALAPARGETVPEGRVRGDFSSRRAVITRVMGALAMAWSCIAVAQSTPSYDCSQKLVSSVEQRICKDAKLGALDREVADVYATALAKVTAADAQSLQATQRSFIKSRNDCWKNTDVQGCVENSYRRRIAELQARYGLVKAVGTARYKCPGPPEQDAAADFFATDPATAMVQYAGATQLMFVAPSGSGARYTGGNRQLWEHQGVALLNWGPGAREMSCPKQ